jgi:cytoskeletal protein CcmA (bactofilin family)
MVFSRKPEPAPVPPPAPTETAAQGIKRMNERAAAAHLGQVPPPAGLAPDSIIGNDLTIEGQAITIRCRGTLRVNGNIQADLHSRALEVGREAEIAGAIAAETVNVYGRVSGAIHGAKVVLHASAEVSGDIHSELLSIEQGATFDGRSRKVRNPAEIAPQLDRTIAPAAAAPAHIERTASGPQPFGSARPIESLVN